MLLRGYDQWNIHKVKLWIKPASLGLGNQARNNRYVVLTVYDVVNKPCVDKQLRENKS